MKRHPIGPDSETVKELANLRRKHERDVEPTGNPVAWTIIATRRSSRLLRAYGEPSQDFYDFAFV